MREYSLSERCKITLNTETDKFVGIECTHGDFCVHFPVGYRLSNDEEGVRRDIRLLINTIADTTRSKESVTPFQSKAFDWSGVPIQSFLYIIKDYYERGLYKEQDIKYVASTFGKIDWSRTIKTQRPYIQDGEAYYLKFVTKKTTMNEDELLTQIHQYCLFASFKAVGWIFTDYMPREPHIKYNEKLFVSVLKNKLLHTFNDRKRLLFWHMLAVIQDVYDKETLNNFSYGVNRFEYVWEKLVDNVFGDKNKKFYFPATYWTLANQKTYDNPKLEPDTIMLLDDDVYVLDAKYYKYGETKRAADLPESTSINKQITYGEYVATGEKFRDKHGNDFAVYNAFVMPFNNEKWSEQSDMRWIGTAWGEWKGKEVYTQIQGVLVDTKTLMEIGSQYSISMVNEIATLIKSHIPSQNDGNE